MLLFKYMRDTHLKTIALHYLPQWNEDLVGSVAFLK